jgi:hypothetical protein
LVQCVAQRIAPIVFFTSLGDSHGTVHGAFYAFFHNQWLQLACYDMPNRDETIQIFSSHYAMALESLTNQGDNSISLVKSGVYILTDLPRHTG